MVFIILPSPPMNMIYKARVFKMSPAGLIIMAGQSKTVVSFHWPSPRGQFIDEKLTIPK
jgi:hypothetical protein